MAGMLVGRDEDLFLALKECGVLQSVSQDAMPLRDGVLAFGCGDDRNARLRDLCTFHEKIQDQVREEPKSFLFGWPGGPLLLTPRSPLVGAIVGSDFYKEAFFTIRRMLRLGHFASFLLHGHYSCLAAEHAIGAQSLFQVINVLFDAKLRTKRELASEGVPVMALCQFDGKDGKKSYYLHRESWDEAYPHLKSFYR